MNTAIVQKTLIEAPPAVIMLPAKCSEKMARVVPQLDGIASHDNDQWGLNADAQDARTAFCAAFVRHATMVPVTIK